MNKKAISAIIGEVLLIVMAIFMAGAVYAWLQFYVSKPVATEFCPDGVSLIISDYSCNTGIINLTMKNQGRYTVDGMIARISNNSIETAAYPLFGIIQAVDENGNPVQRRISKVSFEGSLSPGEEQTLSFDYSDYGTIKYIDIEPTKGTDKYGNPLLCDKAITNSPISGC